MATLESLHAQGNIEQHRKKFLVIVDGQVKGKGMSKSTDHILVKHIFKPEKGGMVSRRLRAMGRCH